MRLSTLRLLSLVSTILATGALAQADHGGHGGGGGGGGHGGGGHASGGHASGGHPGGGYARAPIGHVGVGVHMRPGVGYRSYPPGHYGAGYGVPRYGYGYGYGRGYYFPYYAYGYGAGYYGSSAGGYVAAPAAYGPRPSPWAFGLGVTASALSIGSGEPAADGLGLVARFRGPTLGLEVELGQDRFNDDLRRDTHVGGAFIIPLLGHEVQPYVLVGGGLNVVHFNDTGSDLSQAYLTAGGGLQVHVGQRFDISGDIRAYGRRYVDESDTAYLPASYQTSNPQTESAIEGRVTAILYF